MKAYTVFYAGLLYDEFELDGWNGVGAEIPDGAYLRFIQTGGAVYWYVKQAGSFNPVTLTDVPNELRAMCLLMQ